jgi:hypothetical protein
MRQLDCREIKEIKVYSDARFSQKLLMLTGLKEI